MENIAYSLSQFKTRVYVDYFGKLVSGEISDASKIQPAMVDQIQLPLIGELKVGTLPILGSTFLIAFIDGFPVLWAQVLAQYLGLYLLVCLLDEIIVLLIV